MVLRKCPKCHEQVNAESISCPLCGIVFRDYQIKRVLFWIALVGITMWALHDHLHLRPLLHWH